ncbi:hypothetical protein ACN27F_23965 [Solwaraspora sp. WMMB335]|uniref:hypothetical protein n=1 Tax=Solwaraspora sp. WMMB335 TaxID=3404118 RepID=UPI003B92B039
MSELYRTPYYDAPPPKDSEATRIRVLVTGITPPVPSATYGAVTTLVGLRLNEPRHWIRFDEVAAHPLGPTAPVQRYDVISAVVEPDRTDPRPESWRILNGSLRVQREARRWTQRTALLHRRDEGSMCDLEESAASRPDAQSMALIRIAELRYVRVTRTPVAPPAERWSAATWRRAEADLFRPVVNAMLRRPPFTLAYRYYCHHPACRSHVQELCDREVVAFQQRRRRYCGLPLRRALAGEFWWPLRQPGRQVAFLVGNRRDNPARFDVLDTVILRG